MALNLETLELDDVPTFAHLQWQAFGDADMILPMIYPQGYQDDLKTRLITRFTNAIENPKYHLFCVRDPESAKIISISEWEIEPNCRTNAEMEVEIREALQARLAGVSVSGMNKPLGDAFFIAAERSLHEVTSGKPYMALQILATLPGQERRGAATVQLEWGTREADKLGLPIYLSASERGRLLYERHGFSVVKDFPFNGKDYGGKSEARHWCMLRPAKTASA